MSAKEENWECERESFERQITSLNDALDGLTTHFTTIMNVSIVLKYALPSAFAISIDTFS